MGSVQEEEDGKVMMIACLPGVLGVGSWTVEEGAGTWKAGGLYSGDTEI